jgi:hypothetical protein
MKNDQAMTALKDVGNIAALIGMSALSKSSLWEQDVATIEAQQLHAYIWLQSSQGKRDQAESAVGMILQEVERVVKQCCLPAPPLLDYYREERFVMTSGELRAGLTVLGQTKAAAILFALETGIDCDQIAAITQQGLHEFKCRHTISALAEACLQTATRHASSCYVFWRTEGENTLPLGQLHVDVLDAFGMVWSELVASYENMIMIDAATDLESAATFFAI